MDCSIDVIGEGNLIETPPENEWRASGSSIHIRGNRNRIRIGKGVALTGCAIQIACDDNLIEIEEGAKLTGKVIMKLTDGNRLLIGAGTTVGGCNFICGEGTTIRLGRDCMVAWGVEIRSTDSHAIRDLASGQRINQAQNITIGDHVWVAAMAAVLKGADIASHSVVGIRSVVSDVFPESNVVIAGAPARIVRRGVDWDRPLLG